jgi:hypothetical protein
MLLMTAYGFYTIYKSRYFRMAAGIILWLGIFINVWLYISKVGAKEVVHRAYEYFLNEHNPAEEASLFLYSRCYQAPHNILVHK